MTKRLILNIEGLKIHFDTENKVVCAVDDIAFQLSQGRTIGIVGESGSGKSLTALSIMNLVPKSASVSGKVFYKQRDILSLEQKEIEKIRGGEIAMIFQEPMTSLNPVYKCGTQISESIQWHQKISKEVAKKKVIELFEKVKLSNVERIYEAYPHQLSGGQKQRVMIAMALSCQPKLLIADEPTTALDVTVQRAILDLLIELKHEFQMAVIFISHDLGVIAEIADDVLVMHKGKIVEEGSVEEIFTNPKHPYTKGLVACRPPLDRKLRRLPVLEDFLEIDYNEEGELLLKEKAKGAVNHLQFDRENANMDKRNPILVVKDLKKWFPVTTNFLGKPIDFTKAVDGVSFDVVKGETLGLVGESGSGKTTLGRSILRLIEPTMGKINYRGNDLVKMSNQAFQKLRKEFQIIFQDPYSSLNPRKYIGSSILEPLTFHNMYDSKNARKEKVIELLELVGLKSDHYFRMPHEFSGGQRQRICIARALAMQPKFLVCDECVSSLDVSIQAQILNLLMELKEKHDLTYIFISHDLSVVKFMSDRIMVMKDGRIEEIGDAEDVYRNPQSLYTQKLISAIPRGLG
ncbi:MAG: ABC transporter ATP-binding protein [Bacteroidetes bacterium]|jgi:peptide/nickel transport system ATP-binding protein|nr:ABC transporter ATP-binding protein [Bacteroidota bacterium]MDF1867512.1 ABC transporter ATP-binding protein [Saprospiraceae bacterium]